MASLTASAGSSAWRAARHHLPGRRAASAARHLPPRAERAAASRPEATLEWSNVEQKKLHWQKGSYSLSENDIATTTQLLIRLRNSDFIEDILSFLPEWIQRRRVATEGGGHCHDKIK